MGCMMPRRRTHRRVAPRNTSASGRSGRAVPLGAWSMETVAMKRKITIKIGRTDLGQEMKDNEYADLANAIWMFLRSTPFEFVVRHDGQTPKEQLNAARTQYGEEAHWS
jgi:hypothetical protein